MVNMVKSFGEVKEECCRFQSVVQIRQYLIDNFICCLSSLPLDSGMTLTILSGAGNSPDRMDSFTEKSEGCLIARKDFFYDYPWNAI
jgi:hypothetical protein